MGPRPHRARARTFPLVLSLLFLLPISWLATASPARALTLEEALAAAVRTNPEVRSAREAARGQHEAVVSDHLATRRPNVSFDVSASARQQWGVDSSECADGPLQVRGIDYSTPGGILRAGLLNFDSCEFGDGRTRQFNRNPFSTTGPSLGLSYSQSLTNLFEPRWGLLGAEEGVKRLHALVESSEQRVLLNTATAYLDVFRAERIVRLRETSLSTFEARLREVQAQYRVGDRTRTDLSQAEAEREVAAAEVVSSRAELAAKKVLFEKLVGVPPEALQEADEPSGLPETLDEALRLAREEWPASRMAAHMLRDAELNEQAAEANISPNPNLSIGFGYNWDLGRDSNEFGYREDSTAEAIGGLTLSIPLYTGGGREAALRGAQHARARRQADQVAVWREGEELVTSAWHRLAAARQRRVALRSAVEASRAALDGIRREAAVGERTIREVLDAELDFVTRQLNALGAERDVVVEAYTLLAGAGGLTARKLGISDVPDLEREAEEARRDLTPVILQFWRREPAVEP